MLYRHPDRNPAATGAAEHVEFTIAGRSQVSTRRPEACESNNCMPSSKPRGMYVCFSCCPPATAAASTSARKRRIMPSGGGALFEGIEGSTSESCCPKGPKLP
eukprot:561940-Hanusia_phi.AAC.2